MAVPAPTLYVEVKLGGGGELELPDEHQERGLYVVRGAVEIGGLRVEAGTMAVLLPGLPVTVRAADPCHAMLVGGAALDGPRHLWWNLVTSDRVKLERAAADWQSSIDSRFTGSRFSLPPDEDEFIPLPRG